MKPRRVLERILAGSRNIRFEDARRLAEALGFRLDRVRGSHHIFMHRRPGLRLNLQPDQHGQMKTYQLRQLIDCMEEHGLTLQDHA